MIHDNRRHRANSHRTLPISWILPVIFKTRILRSTFSVIIHKWHSQSLLSYLNFLTHTYSQNSLTGDVAFAGTVQFKSPLRSNSTQVSVAKIAGIKGTHTHFQIPPFLVLPAKCASILFSFIYKHSFSVFT